MSDRPCQRPGCGRQIPGYKRRHARWCSRSCENKARRTAGRLGVALEDYGGLGELLPEEHHSLADLHQQARPPQHWRDDPRNFSDYGDVPGDLDHDDHRDQDDDHQGNDDTYSWLPAQGTADEIRRLRADVASRLDKALQQFSHMIRANYVGDYRLAAQRHPRIRAIVSEYTKEFEAIDAAETAYLKADAITQATRPWEIERRRDDAKGRAAMADFARDLRPSRILETPQQGRATDEAFVFGQPGSVFGSDSELFGKSVIAQNLGQRVYAPDGFLY